MVQQPTQPAARHRKRTHICPEPGSLYDIMHLYSGHRLFVLPICWTDMHTKSLGVHFENQQPILFPCPDIQSLPPLPSPEPSAAAKQLCADLSAFVQPTTLLSDRIRSLKNLLSGFFPHMPCETKTFVDFDMHFGAKSYGKAVKLPIVWMRATPRCNSFDSAATRPMSSSSQNSSASEHALNDSRCESQRSASYLARNAPLLAYIDRDHLSAVRRSLFRISPGPRDGEYHNTPVANLQRLWAKALVPSDPDCDAHFIAVLLAMAQLRFYNKTTGRKRSRLSQFSPSDTPSNSDNSVPNQPDAVINDFEVRLFTFDAATKDFIVYSAAIGADFLEGFAQPSQRLHRGPKGSSSMRVKYTRVPVWPFYGLKERLGKALGSEVTGAEFISPDYDTFQTPKELPLYEAEVEKIRLDEERRYREYTAYSREEHSRLRVILSKSFGGDNKKRSRKSSRSSGAGDGSRSPSASPSKRRRGVSVTG